MGISKPNTVLPTEDARAELLEKVGRARLLAVPLHGFRPANVEVALAINEKTLGPEHPDVAGSLNSLARLYVAIGQFVQAEQLLKRALKITEKALGPHHPNVAQDLGDLASLYVSQNQFARAEPLLRRSLEIIENTLGPDDPGLAQGLEIMAVILQVTGRTEEAKEYRNRASAIRAINR